MSKNKLLVLSLVLVLLVAGFISKDSDIYFEISKSIDLFGKVYKEVTLNYVDDVNPQEFMIAGLKGMLSSLDPYTVYIDADMKKDIDLITTGKYGGIGAGVGIRSEKVTIVDLLEGFSAHRQGIRIGDVIEEVNGNRITKDNYNELRNYLKGKPGEVVTLKIKREGTDDNIVFDLVLEEIVVKNLTYYGFIPENSENVYLKLSGFTRSAGEEIKDALLELNSQKEIKSIVLDLRGNPGGLLDQAIDVAEKFLERKQLIVSVIGKDKDKVTKYFSNEEPVAGNSKLVLLVDNGSASASEIVAGAIQDHDRGIIIGETSFGKGLVQTLLPLSYNTSLKITTARYYTPSGRCIQKVNYSSKNKVIEDEQENEENNFQTDNLRPVFGSGGINPDTTISNDSESSQLKFLRARGMFFKFATYFYNSNQDLVLNSLKDSTYFNTFMAYLNEYEFYYLSKSEKLLDEIKINCEKENYGKEVHSCINSLAEKLTTAKKNELKKYKHEVVARIKMELAARIHGRNGRINESLKNDNQFFTALQILNNEDAYSQMLLLKL
ncbi:S41 family peptidase [Bacteroidota bacterium]